MPYSMCVIRARVQNGWRRRWGQGQGEPYDNVKTAAALVRELCRMPFYVHMIWQKTVPLDR